VFIPAESGYHEEPFPRDVLNLAAIRSDARSVLWENDEAALLDAGQCVALFEFRSKGNSLSRAVMQGLMKAIDQVERDPDLRGMIIGNDGKNFSVGANLAEMAQAAQDRRFDAIDAYLKEFQGAIQRVHYAAKPVVVAVHQRVLGGACELLMASDAPVASAETYVGLVEVGVGLIPAGTGVMRLARRAAQESRTGFPSHLQPHVQRYFEQVLRATVSGSAAEAVTLGYLPEHAHIVMHDDRRLFAAREQVVRLAEMGYRPRPIGGPIRVLGRQGWAALVVLVDQYRQGGFITEYDAVIANRLAYAFTGGDLVGVQDVDESYLLDLEREVFLQLLGEERTQQRVAHMLQHKKPLRN
ncbi:MAG TPA: enoyl-CoA hydratase/isomerase family protein, partial [Rhodothermales bacterium]